MAGAIFLITAAHFAPRGTSHDIVRRGCLQTGCSVVGTARMIVDFNSPEAKERESLTVRDRNQVPACDGRVLEVHFTVCAATVVNLKQARSGTCWCAPCRWCEESGNRKSGTKHKCTDKLLVKSSSIEVMSAKKKVGAGNV